MKRWDKTNEPPKWSISSAPIKVCFANEIGSEGLFKFSEKRHPRTLPSRPVFDCEAVT